MIKFRAWDKNEDKYFIDGNAGRLGNLICCDDLSMLDPNDYVWEQFTGLKDVNGKEIYAGDIIKSSYKYAQPKISQIIIENGNSYILGEDLATGNEMLVSDHIGEIKVISNVHTNPELLEADYDTRTG